MKKSLKSLKKRFILLFAFVTLFTTLAVRYIVDTSLAVSDEVVYEVTVVALAVSFLGSFFTYFFANTLIFKPFKKISHLSKQLAKDAGDLSVRLDVDSNDEVGKAFSHFNDFITRSEKIQKELIKYKDNLELKVKKRTKEISELNEKLEEYVSIVEGNVIISQTDIYGVITYVSEAFCDITGYTEKELVGKPHNIIRHPDMEEETFKRVWQTIADGDVYHGVFKNKKKCDGYFWIEIAIAPRFDKKGNTVGYISIAKDITHQIELETTLKQLKIATKRSQTDSLTGLYNRSRLDELIQNEIKEAKEKNEVISLGFFDIDLFKNVNDNYGHLIGDEVLINLSHFVLGKMMEDKELFGRWGGEEFVIVYKNSDLEEAFLKMEQLRLEVSKENFSTEAKNITISAGVAQLRVDEDERSFVHRADEALYAAKKSGRNKVVKAIS